MTSVERAALPVVRLDDRVGTAVIVALPTGVIYVNQAGGFACMQPSLEGTLVPFGNDVAERGNTLLSAQPALEAYFTGPKHGGAGATSGLDHEDADVIDGILQKVPAGRSISVDRKRLTDSMEAWVHVTIGSEDRGGSGLSGLISGFDPYPRSAVLIWSNSD